MTRRDINQEAIFFFLKKMACDELKIVSWIDKIDIE
jgi:hypothetical protein